MGLLKCPDCGKEFSDRIDACPNCACPKSAILEEMETQKKQAEKEIEIKDTIPETVAEPITENPVTPVNNQVSETPKVTYPQINLSYENEVPIKRSYNSFDVTSADVRYHPIDTTNKTPAEIISTLANERSTEHRGVYSNTTKVEPKTKITENEEALILNQFVGVLSEDSRKKLDSELVSLIDAFFHKTSKLKGVAAKSDIEDYIIRLELINQKLCAIKSYSVENERTAICATARDLALRLYRTKTPPEYVLKIFSALEKEFKDIRRVYTIIKNDSKLINGVAKNKEQRFFAEDRKSRKKKYIGWFVFLGIIILTLVLIIDPIEEEFSQSAYGRVYVDIVSIEPSYMVKHKTNDTYEFVICKSKTSTWKTVWIYMDIIEYQRNFDTNANLSQMVNGRFETVKYSTPKRIHGTVMDITDKFSKYDIPMYVDKKIVDFDSIE